MLIQFIFLYLSTKQALLSAKILHFVVSTPHETTTPQQVACSRAADIIISTSAPPPPHLACPRPRSPAPLRAPTPALLAAARPPLARSQVAARTAPGCHIWSDVTYLFIFYCKTLSRPSMLCYAMLAKPMVSRREIGMLV